MVKMNVLLDISKGLEVACCIKKRFDDIEHLNNSIYGEHIAVPVGLGPNTKRTYWFHRCSEVCQSM